MNKKSSTKKLIGIILAVILVAGVAAWCCFSATADNADGVKSVFNFSSTFVTFTLVFVIVAFGYLLGGIEIKGVSLGTAGVVLVAGGAYVVLNMKKKPATKEVVDENEAENE